MRSRSVGDDLAAPPIVMGILRMRGQCRPVPGSLHATVNQTDQFRYRVMMMTERAPHHLHPDAITDDPPMDDVALLAGVANGDSRALRHLYEDHAGWIAGRLRQKMPPHAVEDVLQETFLAVWRGAGRYGGSGDVGGFRGRAVCCGRGGRCPARRTVGRAGRHGGVGSGRHLGG